MSNTYTQIYLHVVFAVSDFLERHGVHYDERYVFKPIE